MNRFTVPQFIDVEDKILGPITVRQFLILLVCSLTSFLGYKLFDFELFLIWAVGWMAGGVILAFVKINGMPIHFLILNMLQNFRRSSIRVWNKSLTNAQVRALAFQKTEIKKTEKIPVKALLATSTLSELSLIADTGGAYEGETVIEGEKTKIQAQK